MGADVSESSSNAIVTAAAAISATPLAKEGYANGASSRVRAPPPFLLKVYDIVKNPETDSIISWSSSGTSFVVWDPHRFAAEGFIKINWDRLEFQNAWFQKGKKSGNDEAERHGSKFSKETEILEKQAQCITSKRQNMLKYMIHEVLIRKKELQSNDAANDQGSGGRQSIESSVELLEEGGTSHGSRKNSPRAQSGTGKTFSNVDLSTAVQEEEDCTVSMGKFSDFYTAVYSSLEKQLMDDISCENVPEEERENLQQNDVIPLEDLIEGPADWNEFAKGIGNKAKS
nr:heat stress transcription factor A-7a-like [Coffea arabica]